MAIVDSYAKLPDGNKACKTTGNWGGGPPCSILNFPLKIVIFQFANC